MLEARNVRSVALVILIGQQLAGCALETGNATEIGREDARIRADLDAVFEEHPDLSAPNLIYADVSDHVVYLSGLVNTELTIANAEALAREVPGVTRVESSIAVEE